MRRYLAWVISMVAFLSSCKKEKDDPKIQNESEIITTVHYYLVPISGGNSKVFTFKDLDGDGGNLPTITNAILDTNKTYQGRVILLNEQKLPADTISNEVLREATRHQLFYQNTVTGLQTQYDDTDTDGKPLGLTTKLITTTPGSGTLKITLRHEPNKNSPDVAFGDITNAGGETDIEILFDVSVQ